VELQKLSGSLLQCRGSVAGERERRQRESENKNARGRGVRAETDDQRIEIQDPTESAQKIEIRKLEKGEE